MVWKAYLSFSFIKIDLGVVVNPYVFGSQIIVKLVVMGINGILQVLLNMVEIITNDSLHEHTIKENEEARLVLDIIEEFYPLLSISVDLVMGPSSIIHTKFVIFRLNLLTSWVPPSMEVEHHEGRSVLVVVGTDVLQTFWDL